MSIQKNDGSWYDSLDAAPYIFDSAQILKGLIAIRDILPEVDGYIIKGCEWILSNMTDEGRLITPSEDAWGDDEHLCSEIIHLYCISPIIEAGKIYNRADFIEKSKKIINYYKTKQYDKIMNFDLLSHFYAYVMEALLDIGETDMAKEAMGKMISFMDQDGKVPALNNVHWVCSTGLFQLALCWYRLGDISYGDKAFEYAIRLQNEDGGFFGSYQTSDSLDEENIYFPDGEISWAIKFYLDALLAKNKALFEAEKDSFNSHIEKDDGRYIFVKEAVRKTIGDSYSAKILDVGCGKGRYLNNLAEDISNAKYYGVDISSVMDFVNNDKVILKTGSLTDIPYEDNFFDMVYASEALEHAIDIKSALNEMARVVRPGGRIVIVDKNTSLLGIWKLEEWEQWFDEEELKNMLLLHCKDVKVQHGLSYTDGNLKDLFSGWEGLVK